MTTLNMLNEHSITLSYNLQRVTTKDDQVRKAGKSYTLGVRYTPVFDSLNWQISPLVARIFIM